MERGKPGEGRRIGGLGERSPGDDVRREIRAHIEMRTEELVAGGMDPVRAREEARRRFGDEERVAREAERMSRGKAGRSRWFEDLRQDGAYALRSLARSPSFALMAIVTLALGIGANVTIFSVIEGVLLAPLPYAAPERIVWVAETTDGGSRTMAVAWPNLVDWRERSTSFAGLAPFGSGPTLVAGGEQAVRVGVARVGEDFWDVFPVQPLQGRLTVPDDHRFGVEPVAVVSRRFWETELGGEPVGERSIETSGHRLRVVGVLPAGFQFPDETDVWIAAELAEPNVYRTAHNWSVVGRLADGASVERAEEELDRITLAVVSASGEDPEYLADGARVLALQEQIVGSARRPLLLLMGAAGFVLLVACTNLASTLLARGAVRARELAVRASLGAARGRLIRQLLTESLILAALGAAAGVLLGALLVRALQAMGPGAVPRLGEIGLSGGVLAFTAAVTVGTALLFGLLPALRMSEGGGGEALRQGRGSTGTRGPLWRVLVGTEVALALVLLTGSGLLMRSFGELLAADAGFDGGDVLAAEVDLSQLKYPDPFQHGRWHAELLERLAALPGVASAGVVSSAPLSGFLPNGRMELDGDPEKFADGGYVAADPGFFAALDIPLLQGRLFEASDGEGSPWVAIVSRSFAERYWPGEDAVGKQVTGGGMDDLWQERPFATVVGVVGDVRYRDLGREPAPTVYFPAAQRPFRIRWGATVLVEAAAGAPSSLAAEVRALASELDPDAALRLRTMDEVVSGSLADRRFPMLVLGAFALVALALAVVGIHGVVSYGVARRTREMGIRMALGAAPGLVVRQVVRESIGMVAAGLVVGVLGALALSRVLAGLLYGVSATDPLTLVGVVALLLGFGFLASWVPARAGTRIDPMVTMRAE